MHVLHVTHCYKVLSFPDLIYRPEKALALPKIVYNLSPATKPTDTQSKTPADFDVDQTLRLTLCFVSIMRE